MTTFRPIAIDDYAKIARPATFGPPPKLEWIAIKQLVVDPEYQRDITPQGRGNVRRIASSFNWSMFTPVVVASVGSNKYAIVDGQHRTTAALICGIDKVPCAIIEAVRSEQAAAFRAINANTTQLNSMQLHYAALAAGDEKAQRIERVCRTAEVVILRYPKDWRRIEPGETMSVKIIARAILKFGDDCVIATLKAIRETNDGNAGMLRGPVIYGSAEVLHDHPEWVKQGGALLDAFDRIDLAEMLAEASGAAARLKGSSITDQFESRLVAALADFFKGKRAA